jgi:hypothetical protein
MLVCDGSKRWRRRDRRSRAELQFGAIVPSLAAQDDWTAVRLKNSMPSGSQQIRSIAGHKISTGWLCVGSRLRNEDLKPANLMGLTMSEDNFRQRLARAIPARPVPGVGVYPIFWFWHRRSPASLTGTCRKSLLLAIGSGWP